MYVYSWVFSEWSTIARILTPTFQELEQKQDKPSKILKIQLRSGTLISISTPPHLLHEIRETVKQFTETLLSLSSINSLFIYFRKRSYCISAAQNNSLLWLIYTVSATESFIIAKYPVTGQGYDTGLLAQQDFAASYEALR